MLYSGNEGLVQRRLTIASVSVVYLHCDFSFIAETVVMVSKFSHGPVNLQVTEYFLLSSFRFRKEARTIHDQTRISNFLYGYDNVGRMYSSQYDLKI